MIADVSKAQSISVVSFFFTSDPQAFPTPHRSSSSFIFLKAIHAIAMRVISSLPSFISAAVFIYFFSVVFNLLQPGTFTSELTPVSQIQSTRECMVGLSRLNIKS